MRFVIDGLRFPVRVRPGASRTVVGGRYGSDTGSAALVVAVSAPAVDGAANRSAIEALAAAFDVRRAAVEIVSGATSRSKIVRIAGDTERLAARFAVLLDG